MFGNQNAGAEQVAAPGTAPLKTAIPLSDIVFDVKVW